MYLYVVSLFYHPSGDHLDPDPDIERRFYLVSEKALDNNAALSRVLEKDMFPDHYRHEVVSVDAQDLTLERGARLLKELGLRVIE